MQKRILIYRLGSLGDTIIVLPCFNKIKEVYADADITLLTNRPVAAKAAPLESVLGKQYFFNRILDYPVGTRNPLLLAKLLFKLRAHKIDIIINLSAARSPKAARRDKLFFKLAGIKKFVGFPSTPEDFNPVLTDGSGERKWEAERIATRIKEIGRIDLSEEKAWDLHLSDDEKAEGNALVRSLGSFIAISAGTKMQSKDWEEANWSKLIGALSDKYPGFALIMVGAPDEFDLSQRCLQNWKGVGYNLCGKTSPRVSGVVLKKASLFIGHDSGPMHLAACVGTPCVAIFSARNIPRQWYPRGDNNVVIYHKTDCAGCGLEVCIEQKKKCVLSISVDEVISAVDKVIKLPISTAG